MALLEYQFRITGRENIERELATLERRYAAHNQKLANESQRAAGRVRSGYATRNSPRYAGPDNVRDLKSNQREIDKIGRTQQSLARQRLREETAVSREQAKAARAQQQSIDRQSRSQQALARQRAQEARANKAALAGRVDFVKQTIGNGAGRVFNGLAAAGRMGLAATGIGGVALAASAVNQAITLDDLSRRVSIKGRMVDGKYEDPAALKKQFSQVAIATGLKAEDVGEGLSTYIDRTGDIDTGKKNLKTFATFAQATGSNIKDVANVGADLALKFDLKNVNEVEQAFAELAYQGKKGAFEIADMAHQFPEMAAAAQRAGMRGLTGLRTLGGLAQIAREATGSGAEASTAVQMMLTQLVNKADKLKSGKLLGGAKVDVFEGGDARNRMRPVQDVLAEIFSADEANQTHMSKTFDIRGSRATSPFIENYRQGAELAEAEAQKKGRSATKAERQEYGRQAILANIEKHSSTGATWQDVQKDSAEAMKSVSVQLEILNEKLKAAIASKLFPAIEALIPKLTDLVPLVGRLMEGFMTVAKYLLDNPFKSLGIAITGAIIMELAKARIATVLTAGLTAIMQGIQTGGLRGGLGAVVPTVGGNSWAGAIGAAGTGLAIGAAVGGAIYTGGIAKFEAGEASMESAGQQLNAVRGAKGPGDIEMVRQAIAEQKRRVAEAQKRDLLDDALAWGSDLVGGPASNKDVEQKTQETFLAEMQAKLVELQTSATAQKEAAALQKEAAEAIKTAAGGFGNRGDKPTGVK